MLTEELPALVGGLSFKKSMRWRPDAAFSRPMRWLLALHGETVVPFTYAGLQAGAAGQGTSRSHASSAAAGVPPPGSHPPSTLPPPTPSPRPAGNTTRLLRNGDAPEAAVAGADAYLSVLQQGRISLGVQHRKNQIWAAVQAAAHDVGGARGIGGVACACACACALHVAAPAASARSSPPAHPPCLPAVSIRRSVPPQAWCPTAHGATCSRRCATWWRRRPWCAAPLPPPSWLCPGERLLRLRG